MAAFSISSEPRGWAAKSVNMFANGKGETKLSVNLSTRNRVSYVHRLKYVEMTENCKIAGETSQNCRPRVPRMALVSCSFLW